MKKFTFLGMSEAALSMFIEILHASHRENFSITIVQNLKNGPVGRYSFEIPGIKCSVVQSCDWQYDEHANFIIGVNLVESKRAVFNAFESS